MIPAKTVTKLIADLSAGETIRKAAINHNVSNGTVMNIKNKNRALIKEQSQKLIDKALTKIVDQTVNEIAASEELSKELIQALREDSQIIKTKDGKALELFPKERIQALNKFLERTDKKAENIQKSVGLLPSHAPSLVFNTIYSNNSVTLSEGALRMLGNNAITAPPEDMIEGEIDEG